MNKMKKHFSNFSIVFFLVFLFFANTIIAQTGPGGVGNTTTNVLWLKAEDISLSDGLDITTWADASGNTNDLSQDVDLFKPIYKTNIVNGFPVVRFSKPNARIRRNSFANFPTSNITAIYVNKNDGDSGEGILSYASTSSDNDFLLFDSSLLRFYRGGVSTPTPNITTLNNNQWHIVNSSWRSSNGSVSIWLDGIKNSSATISSGTPITAGGNFAIAGEQDSVDGGYNPIQAHQGDFTEVLVFNSVLNDAQQIIVSNYLGAKYGIPISNDFYSYQAVHYFDVAGIGRRNSTNTHLTAMSASVLQVENATNINANNEFLLFGHDNGDITTSWTTTEAPDAGVNIKRIAREWRLDETGTVGNIDFVVDTALLPTIELADAAHTMYALMVDADGDFSNGANVYEMTNVSGTRYRVTGVDFSDGDYVSIAIVNPQIQHVETSGSDSENENAIIEVFLNFIPQADRTVLFTTADGTATSGLDYTGAVATPVTIFAGTTTNDYSVVVDDDADPETTETFTSTLSSPTAGLNLGTNTVFTYSISDNDVLRKVYFEVASSNGNENISPVTVDLEIDIPDPTETTSVQYSVTGGTASGSGVDYTPATGTVFFTATITTGSFSFTVNDDSLKENNETIIITLSNPVNCNLDNIIGGGISHTYTINDNDANPEIQFTNATASGLESVSPVNFEVSLSEVSGVDTSANYTVTTTGTDGLDFVMASGLVTILAGSTTTNLTAIIANDSETEINETITITLSGVINGTLGTNAAMVYTILDDDSFGYTGPGGVGDSNANILWLDADQITGFGDNVDLTAWADVSGNSKDASIGSTDSPTYHLDEVNGFPVVRFDASKGADGSRIVTNPFTDFATEAITAIFVNKNSETTPTALLSYASIAGGSNDFLFFDSSDFGFYRGTNDGASGVSINDNSWHIINTSWESFTGNVAIWKDGLEEYLSTHSVANITSGGSFAIGGEQDAVDDGYDNLQAHTGDIPEVILYNVYLNDAQQIIVDNYLAAKYDINISNDIYTQDGISEGDFDFNVAGIGSATDGSFHLDARGNGIVRIYNPSSLLADDYLFWGRNNKTTYSFVTNTNNYKERISSEWRVSKQNDLGTVTFEVDLTGIDINGKQSCASLNLIVGSDLLAPTNTYVLTNTTGEIYQATGVSFTDGDFFTIEYQDKIVVDNNQFYNGSGTSSAPSTGDTCFKLLVKNTANGTVVLTENANVREVEVELDGILAIDDSFLEVVNGIANNGEIRLVGTSQLLQSHTGVNQVSGSGNLFKDQTAVTTNVFQSGYWSSPVVREKNNTYTINDVLKDGSVPTTAVASAGAAIDIEFTDGSTNDFLDGDANTVPITISGRWLAKLIDDIEFKNPINPELEPFLPAEGWNMKSIGATFTFKGIPNDGTYTTTINQNNYSLIGNPYPSAIDADLFIVDNASAFNGVLYFYDGSNDATHIRADYTGMYHTRVNGVTTPAETTAISGTNYYIPVGQAFFVTREAAGTGTITFQNSQRVLENIGAQSQFFSRNGAEKISENTNPLSLLRLGFSFNVEEGNVFKRELAIAFRGLTNNYEAGYDAEMFDKQPSDLALKMNDRDGSYVIAGVDYLDEDMRIPLELYLDKNREVTFHLDALENMNATIYLEDAVEGVSYNLSESTAILSLSTGDYTDRFFISFKDRTVLSTNDLSFNKDFSLFYDGNLKQINVQTKNDAVVLSMKIYNLLGQEVQINNFAQKLEKETIIDVSHLSSTIYVVKLATNKGVFSKKIIKN
jgi:hypothetical protein